MIHLVKADNERTAPVITCDECDQRITHAGDAFCLWKRGEVLPDDGRPYFVHKVCLDRFEGSSREWVSMELNDFLRRLVHNSDANVHATPDSGLLDKL